jgi:small-conductance mechanosensitive channel
MRWTTDIPLDYLPFLFRILAGTVSSGVRKYSLVIKALEIPLSLVGWAVTTLASFLPLMKRNPDTARLCQQYQNLTQTVKANIVANGGYQPCATQHWENIVQKILAAALVATVIYLVEKTIIQLISINYHRKQFTFRIRDSKRNVWILGLLYDASRYLFPMYCHEFAEEDYTIADQLNLSRGSKTPAHVKSGSATPMRVLQNVGAGVDKLTSVFGHVAQEVTGKQVFNPNAAHSIVVEALEKNRTAEALARRLWMSFVVEGRDSLLYEDVLDVLGPERKEEADEAFAALDRDSNGDISLDEMVLTVTEWGRERKSIASSMHDVDQAINVLDRMLAFVVFIIVILVFVAFLNTSFVTTLATTGTALLSLSFVFAASAQEVLGSCIFLFVKHPYDIGDRVDIGTAGCTNQEQFVVEHISLLYTVFRHVQGTGVGRLCQIPNIVLNTLWVENVSRSKAMTEQLAIDVAFGTSFDDLNILKNEMVTFVTDSNNSRDFQPTVDIDVIGTSDQSKMTIMVEVKHKSNWANETIRRARRSKFMCALVSALKVVPIYPPGGGIDVAGSAANPTYSVGITHPEAKEHADVSAKAREDARLVPTKKIEEAKERFSPTVSRNAGAGMTSDETRVVEELTDRNPAVDPARDDAWTSGRDDSTTLGERPSVDQSDIDDLRGLLRRESTRGKRKPSSEWHPTIPTINEPSSQQSFHYPPPSQSSQQSYHYPSPSQPQQAPVRYSNYQPTLPTGYENQDPMYPTIGAPYRPPVGQYQVAATAAEMSQVPPPQPQRSPSNPYRRRSESVSRKPLSPPNAGELDSAEEEFNTRPYSGV